VSTNSKPWYKRIPWWGWVAAVVVLMIIGGIQNLANPKPDETPAAETPVAATPAETVAPTPTEEPEPALASGDDVAAYVSESLGYADLDAACEDEVRWACNVDELVVESDKELRVIVSEPHAEVQPKGIAVGFFNFVTGPLEDGTESLLPKLRKVVVSDAAGEVLAVKRG